MQSSLGSLYRSDLVYPFCSDTQISFRSFFLVGSFWQSSPTPSSLSSFEIPRCSRARLLRSLGGRDDESYDGPKERIQHGSGGRFCIRKEEKGRK